MGYGVGRGRGVGAVGSTNGTWSDCRGTGLSQHSALKSAVLSRYL